MSSKTVPQTYTYVTGSSDPEQQLDLYLPTSSATSLVVFVHGGAWRTGSRKDHADLANYLASKGRAVAVIDYRLSTKNKENGETNHVHPAHAQDVNAALSFLHGAKNVPQKDWVVVGHSIGAWLTLAAIIDGEPQQDNGEYPKPMPKPDSGARECIKTCVLVDGIYSVSKLLEEYPDYEGFVGQAFLPQPGPSNYDIVSCETWPLALEGKELYVWHSRDDELLSFKQSLDVILHLDQQLTAASSAKKTAVTIPEDGLASTTMVNGERKSIASTYGCVEIRNAAWLHADLTSIRGAHDDLLHTETFWDLILTL